MVAALNYKLTALQINKYSSTTIRSFVNLISSSQNLEKVLSKHLFLKKTFSFPRFPTLTILVFRGSILNETNIMK